MPPRTQRHQPVRYTRGAGMMGERISASNLRRIIGGTSVSKEMASSGDVPSAKERLVVALSKEVEQLANSRSRAAEVRERVARQGSYARIASSVGIPIDMGERDLMIKATGSAKRSSMETSE